MTDRDHALLDELERRLGEAAFAPPAKRSARVADGLAALRELRDLLASRRWPRVVRGGLPPGPHFLKLDDRQLTALLAETQDAHGELQERLRDVEAQLRDCQARLQAASSGPSSPMTPPRRRHE
jgi:hypothetical protein